MCSLLPYFPLRRTVRREVRLPGEQKRSSSPSFCSSATLSNAVSSSSTCGLLLSWARLIKTQEVARVVSSLSSVQAGLRRFIQNPLPRRVAPPAGRESRALRSFLPPDETHTFLWKLNYTFDASKLVEKENVKEREKLKQENELLAGLLLRSSLLRHSECSRRDERRRKASRYCSRFCQEEAVEVA